MKLIVGRQDSEVTELRSLAISHLKNGLKFASKLHLAVTLPALFLHSNELLRRHFCSLSA